MQCLLFLKGCNAGKRSFLVKIEDITFILLDRNNQILPTPLPQLCLAIVAYRKMRLIFTFLFFSVEISVV